MRLLCALSLVIAPACVPWTVVPIEEEQASRPLASDPQAYVESIWASRLIPAALAAPDFADVRDSASPTLVTLHGRALSLDTSSRSGKLLVDVAPFDNEPDAAVLTGPVILATSARDAAGFIQFTDFANQLDYADVSNVLNQRVLDKVIAPLDLDSLPGRAVTVHGAWTPADSLPEIVPLQLEVEVE